MFRHAFAVGTAGSVNFDASNAFASAKANCWGSLEHHIAVKKCHNSPDSLLLRRFLRLVRQELVALSQDQLAPRCQARLWNHSISDSSGYATWWRVATEAVYWFFFRWYGALAAKTSWNWTPAAALRLGRCLRLCPSLLHSLHAFCRAPGRGKGGCSGLLGPSS